MHCDRKRVFTGLAGLLLGASAHATQYVITTGINDPAYKDECTLYGAIQNINNQNNQFYPKCKPGTAINTIDVKVPQIDVTHEMSITGHTTIIRSAILVAKGKTRFFRMASPGATLMLERVSMQGGNVPDSGSGGAILVDQGNLVLTTVNFFDNRAGTDGGALAFLGYGKLTTKFVTYERNQAGRSGGAVELGGQTPAGEAAASLRSSKFIDNQAVLDGGAVHCRNPERRATIALSSFAENQVTGANGTGGAISSFCDLDVLISRFRRNIVDVGRGGAMYLAGPRSSVLDTDMRENLAGAAPGALGEGGGIYLDGSGYIIRGGLHANAATTAGGGIFVGDAAALQDVQIANVTFNLNRATSGATKRHGAAVRFTGFSFPKYPLDPQLGYEPHSAQFVNNTMTDNDGLEQVYFEPGAANAVGEIFFVNNLMRSIAVPGCGGMVTRMQPRRPNAPGTYPNLQYPGFSCDLPGDPMPESFAVLDEVKFGGLLGQAHRPPVDPSPALLGDKVVCDEYPVFGQDQLRTPRECLIGAVELSLPEVTPAEFYP